MKKETLYLDTSVPSAYYDKMKPERQKLTWEFWKKLEKYEVYISEMTEIELKNTKERKKRNQFLSLIAGMEILPITEEVIELVQIYLKNKVVPKAKEEDAYHIAVATLNEIDIIAFSQGPGIGSALEIGGLTARTLSLKYKKPLIGGLLTEIFFDSFCD